MMFGMTLMLLVIVLPILVIGLLLGEAAVLQQNRVQNAPTVPIQNPFIQPKTNTSPAARYCAHCGAGMQSDWTHCPQCGAPV